MFPTPSLRPSINPLALQPATSTEAWLAWRTGAPRAPERLSVAELAECCCPDLCDRDHANE